MTISKSKLIPLVDLDSIVYRCGFASDSANDRQGEELSYCLHSVKMNLQSIMEVFEPNENARLFLQGKGNYRDKVATILPYKGNRDPSKRPTWYDEIREYMVDYWHAELVEGMEVDDRCGIEQWKHSNRSTCIVTIDKDLDMIPGWHYNYVKGIMYDVSLAEANKNFFTQILTGDSTDNILGCGKMEEVTFKTGKKAGQSRIQRVGVGPAEAEKILDGKDTWVDQYQTVLQEYKNRGLDQAAFHENATLLWMQREEWVNYNGERLDGESSSGDSGGRDQGESGRESQEVLGVVAGSD